MVNFTTAYLKDGKFERDFKKISYNYLRFWFWVDILVVEERDCGRLRQRESPTNERSRRSERKEIDPKQKIAIECKERQLGVDSP